MQKISEEKMWPVKNTDSLEHDEMLLNRDLIDHPNREYLWILRDDGTCLIPLYEGVDPMFVKYWPDNFYYHVVEDKLNAIPEALALSLIHEPPFNVNSCTTLSVLVDKMSRLLNEPSAQNEIFNIDGQKTSQSSWSQWKETFEFCGNELMVEFIEKVEIQATRLTQLRLVA
ncbi:hypothetical protein [Shewanella algicola]|uniref:hypothetical protein n=1 Tax=Shewanella algicola TaxID=640633 RepID=UPI002493DBFD|nr:hypothetical protein [Shewanella algicola]